MISCECLNFIATSLQLQRSFLNSNSAPVAVGGGNGNNNNSSNNNSAAGDSSLPALLSQMFVQKYPRDFLYYSNFMDFFKNANGPIPDLTVNAISQRDLIYSLTLDVAAVPHQNQPNQSWQFYICINCKMVLCAKRLIFVGGAGATTPTATLPTSNQYLINSQLLVSSTDEELQQRRSHKSFSEIFELVIMDDAVAADDVAASAMITTPPTSAGILNSTSSLSIGSLLQSQNSCPLDGRVQRLRQLHAYQHARVQAEINETTERIDRYTEQKFALLKSFREKCDQEAALLSRLIQQVPEQTCELLDRGMPVALEVVALTTATRRRNTLSSRPPTTPTTPLIQPPSFMMEQQPQQQQQQQLPASAVNSSIMTSRKMSNFDTPPATPEATPMSVGNSPTFRQQQQQQQQGATVASNSNPLLLSSTTVAAGGGDDADDCLFDLEDVDAPSQGIHLYQQQQQQQQYQRLQQQQLQQQQDNMSDADEAEDALDLDGSLPIPMRDGATAGGAGARGQFMVNFARSLPVEIANSPLAERASNNNHNNHNNNNQHHHPAVLEDEEVLDNTVDIAASIKALAKSVHGEPVFGDLPRPRLRSQI